MREGSFATVGEVFPAADSAGRWWLPINVVLVRDGKSMSEASLAERPHLRQKVQPLRNVERVAGETELVPGVRLVPTPGHTPGHTSVKLGDSLLVLGDVVVHELQAADPDILYVSDNDAIQAAATRRRILGELADAGARVIVSHFAGIGRFERAGKGFRWAVE